MADAPQSQSRSETSEADNVWRCAWAAAVDRAAMVAASHGNDAIAGDILQLKNTTPVSEQQAWIPCSERMPPDLQKVLVRFSDGEVLTRYRLTGQWFNTEHDAAYSVGLAHWMPMPPSPAERN